MSTVAKDSRGAFSMSTITQKDTPSPAERPAPLRFITATSLFDGHDAAIHLIRRLLVAQGAEVIHLGHNRSVEEIVRAACQEDADGVAISSYQGGHLEFFRYLVERLRAQGAGHIRVFGGGGATISAAEAEALEQEGVERVMAFAPHAGDTPRGSRTCLHGAPAVASLNTAWIPRRQLVPRIPRRPHRTVGCVPHEPKISLRPWGTRRRFTRISCSSAPSSTARPTHSPRLGVRPVRHR